ncbi:MAG: VWA domain-containing protein [bacterium]|nr:VWA domain-containing protein [bacterium]
MIIFEPIPPWSYLAVAAAVLAGVLLLLRGLLDYTKGKPPWHTLGGSKLTRTIVLILSLITAALLAFASLNPYWTDKPGNARFHLQVAVDVSDSVLRAQGGWEHVRKIAYDAITTGVDATPNLLRSRCTAGILTFRKNTNEALKQQALKDLPEALSKLDRSMFASGEGTHIQAGLNRASSLLEKAGGQGSVLLISDGNQTDGNALTAAQQLARQGVPVHVLPITSRSPAIAITDADLPRLTHTNVQTYVRGLLLNRLTGDKQADFALMKTAKEDNQNGESNVNKNENTETLPPIKPAVSSREISLPAGKWVRFRWPVLFDTFGVQFIDLSLAPSGSKEPHRRRFFTYAKRPPRILSIGGDNRWISAIPGDVAEIIPIPSGIIVSKEDLKEIDAVVISAVPSDAVPFQTQLNIIDAVENKGKGLLLINGGHHSDDTEMETVIMSYKDSPLQRLLPVIGGPRPFTAEPPSRQVAIIIDTSGSMGGWKIKKAQEIARYIVNNLMRPKDRLDIITFTTGAGHLIVDRFMNETGRQDALSVIDRIKASGGTDPNRALSLIGSRTMKECGIIFISDGEFGYIKYRPDCRVTAFEIGSSIFSRSKALKQLADPISVNNNFDPKAITIPYFDPQEREKFFEAEPFPPLSMERHLPKHLRLPVPEMELNGSAVSYLKEGGILNGVRPKLIDPVLAFGQTGTGWVGFFASELAGQWIKKKEGQKAIETWIGRLVPFMERDRYDFLLEDWGDSIDLRVSLVAKTGTLPRVTGMEAVIQFPGGEFSGVPLRPDDSTPGTFHGEIRTDRKNHARKAILSLRETGPNAVPRAQRIPITIPPKGLVNPSPTAEAYTYGQNRQLLRQIAESGGGIFDPPKGTPFFKEKSAADQGKPLWPLLAVIAAFCYLTAITLKRWNP